MGQVVMSPLAGRRVDNFRRYAADCIRQAEGQQTADDKAILLNVALAWVRLAQQTEAQGTAVIAMPRVAPKALPNPPPAA
jgi:hypothetical protein